MGYFFFGGGGGGGGVIFGPGFLWVLLKALGNFLGFDFIFSSI